jgi:ABC-type antimicrobial peptide transport system permease subunit
MEKNVGTVDKVVRGIVALAIIIAYILGWISGIVGLVLAVGSGMLLSSVMSGHCPLYVKLGVNTNR